MASAEHNLWVMMVAGFVLEVTFIMIMFASFLYCYYELHYDVGGLAKICGIIIGLSVLLMLGIEFALAFLYALFGIRDAIKEDTK